LEPMLTMASHSRVSSMRDPRDTLNIDLDQATHHLLVHLVEVARVRIKHPIVALDGVLSSSTSATSPSRSLSKARTSRRRQMAKVREGTRGVCHGGTGGGEAGATRGAGACRDGLEGGEDGGRLARARMRRGARDVRVWRPTMAQRGGGA
jgi:hypothetical protein